MFRDLLALGSDGYQATGVSTAAAAGHVAVVALAGERVELRGERALNWPRERTLFITDG